MEKKFKRIGVLTSGGDAPGMNSVIKSVTCAALEKGVEVIGILGGYSGLINDRTRTLSALDVSDIVSRGGTMLYSDRCDEFKTEQGMQKAIATCKKLNIDGIIAIGGDGTFRGATDLSIRGIPCIGVSGTIDNDITATDTTVGFDTAMNTVISLGDALRDTCESHARCCVIEVMGRNAGYIAAETGLALNAIGVVLSEMPFDKSALFAKMKKMRDLGQRSFIVVVAEGMGGTFAEALTKEIEAETGIESRFVRPAHIVRGGIPTLADRSFAAKCGYKAVEALLEGKSDLVICSRKGEIVTTDIRWALIVDRMYKGKLKDGDLDSFSEEQQAKMRAAVAERRAEMEILHGVAETVNL